MIRDKYKVGGIWFKVVPTTEKGTRGLFDHDGQNIEIDPSLPVPLQETTVLHEIIEAIDTMHELKLKHRTILRLESSLYQVLKDNFPLFPEDR